jgi:hypothetical protein
MDILVTKQTNGVSKVAILFMLMILQTCVLVDVPVVQLLIITLTRVKESASMGNLRKAMCVSQLALLGYLLTT